MKRSDTRPGRLVEDEAARAASDSWNRETRRFLEGAFKVRLAIASTLAAVLAVFYLWDSVPWKLAWISATASLVIGYSFFEAWRLRRVAVSSSTVLTTLLFAAILQSSIIFITGGIESPFMLIGVPLGVLAGLSLGGTRRMLLVAMIPSLAAVVFAAGGGQGWLPRATPAFFGLEPGFQNQPVYAWTRAGAVAVVTCIAAGVGVVIRRAYSRATRELLEARESTVRLLESRNRELLSVSANIADAIKNPLATLQGLAQLLSRPGRQRDRDEEHMKVLLNEVRRMAAVIEEFQTFARPLSDLHLDQVGLLRLCTEAVQLCEEAAFERQVEIEILEVSELLVVADESKLKHAVVNLIRVCLDGSPEGSRVDVGVEQDGQDALVRILGSSEAKPQPESASIDSSVTDVQLAVARQTAEQHGGALDIRRAPIFEAKFHLPLGGTSSPYTAST